MKKIALSIPLALMAACAEAPLDDAVAEQDWAAQTVTIDPRRSLVVTEQSILQRFGFARVMDQLVAQSGVPGLTSTALFQQWWDTQNPAPGLGLGPHCNDVTDASGVGLVNAFPYTCRPAPAEGALSGVDPFVNPASNPDAYIPIGLFNRFDLAPGDGSYCGEYRIVYARRGGQANAKLRNLIIVESALPNPHPQQGLKGCRKIAEFWAELSAVASPSERADRLEQFYFTGIPDVEPVIHVDHLGGGPLGVGQMRTNQFMQDGITPLVWSLREFKLVRTCAGGACSAMRFEHITVKGNPFGPLFAPGNTHAKTPGFQTAFPSQTANLAAAQLADIDVEIDDTWNSAQSQASGTLENNYVSQFGVGASTLRSALAAQLTALGSTLTPDNLVARAQALSCAGCHRLSNNQALGGGLIWPASLGFTHVSERDTETVDGELRFLISPALVSSFLPKRKQVLEDYLNDKLKNPKKPKDPIGGRRTH